jgi:hypothetical protein
MNNKDKEAFEAWYINTDTIPVINNLTGPRTYNYFTLEQVWQAACEYKEAENKKLRENILLLQEKTLVLGELEAENKKLREALEYISKYKSDEYLSMSRGSIFEVAREALKDDDGA